MHALCSIDLFDDEGFSLSDINKVIVDGTPEDFRGDADEDLLANMDALPLSTEEKVDLQKAKVCMFVDGLALQYQILSFNTLILVEWWTLVVHVHT